MGVAPTGKAVEWESLGIAHFRDGQMYRVWVQPDLMGLLQQLGVEMPAMASALISALTRRPVRRDVAMTGEITLRGKVLPIGGLKEKVLAAHRAGIGTMIIPRKNGKDLIEIPAHVRRNIQFVLVDDMSEVLETALVKEVIAEADPELGAPPPLDEETA
jgi:predicted ATP-dependent Lon-type protease